MKSFETISALTRSSTVKPLGSSGPTVAVGGAAFALLVGLTSKSSIRSMFVAPRFGAGVGRIGFGGDTYVAARVLCAGTTAPDEADGVGPFDASTKLLKSFFRRETYVSSTKSFTA